MVDTVYTIVPKREVKTDQGGEAFGVTMLGKTEIEIESGASKERQRWSLIHELAHATFHETGMCHELAQAIGDEKAELVEEDVIRRFVPALLATLRSAKVIR